MSEASYRAIFDAAEDAIFVHDIETGAIVDVNPKACVDVRLHARGVPTARRRHARHRRAPLYPGRRDGTVRTRGCREQLRIEWHGRSKDGTLRWHEVFGQARDHRRTGSNTGARARHHRPQDGRGGAARERRAVSLHVHARRSTDWRCGTPRARSSIPIPRCGGCTATATASSPRCRPAARRARRIAPSFSQRSPPANRCTRR